MKTDELYILFLCGCVALASLAAYTINDDLESCQAKIEVIKNEKL